jgi:ABC-type spermidine/putrescine transport system permease subunit I
VVRGRPSGAPLHTLNRLDGDPVLRRLIGPVLVLPALATVTLFFVVPLLGAVTGAFQSEAGFGLENFAKTYELYRKDVVFTLLIVATATVLIGIFSTAIAGYLTLGNNPLAVALLRWLYRWPLFIPFIVVGQILRTFLAKNGMMNNILLSTGLVAPLHTTSFLDWRGIVIAFVWKQTPFVTLLLAGAMASLDRGTIEAARNLGASRLRILIEIVLPQVAPTLMVGLMLSFVTMMSVLSVPLMINAQSPTMITADMAFRINAYGDYGVANALGLISLAMTGGVAWFYLRQTMRENMR